MVPTAQSQVMRAAGTDVSLEGAGPVSPHSKEVWLFSDTRQASGLSTASVPPDLRGAACLGHLSGHVPGCGGWGGVWHLTPESPCAPEIAAEGTFTGR